MGMFTSSQKAAAENIYTTTKKYLKKKDGKIHVILINSFSKWLNQNFGCDDKYTTQIDTIISLMQEDGYEIIDIKINSLQNQGLTGQLEGFHTLITYR